MVGSWEGPYLYLAKHVKSRHLRQPGWCTAPVQKKLVKTEEPEVVELQEPPFSLSEEEAGETDCGRTWRKAFARWPGKEPACEHGRLLQKAKDCWGGWYLSEAKKGTAKDVFTCVSGTFD